MKRFIFVALIIVLLASLNSVLAESAFETALRARYADSGWQVEQVSQWGDAGAALLRRGTSHILCAVKNGVFCKSETALIGNLSSENEQLNLLMDTDDALFLTYYSDLDSYTYTNLNLKTH